MIPKKMSLNTCAHCMIKLGPDKHLIVSTNAQSGELLIDCFMCAKYQDKAARNLK